MSGEKNVYDRLIECFQELGKACEELGRAFEEFQALMGDPDPDPEPEPPRDCDGCGSSYESCTERVYGVRKACCGTCEVLVTHDQNAWEEWDYRRRGKALR